MVAHRWIQLCALVCLTWAIGSSAVQALPPTVTNVIPRGAERGKAVEIVISGANLTPKTQLHLPFKATQTVQPDAKPNPAQVRIQLTVDAAVPVGIYPVRLVTEEGISPLFFFGVDVFPNINEVEDNSSFEKAQKLAALPVIVTGQCAGGDVDYFRFPARKGQKLVIEAESSRMASAVLPQLRLTDAEQRFLAADDTQSLDGDGRIVFDVQADGDYVVEISDSRYRGGNPPHYRLKIAEYDVIEEVFPPGGKRGETIEFTLRGPTLANPIKVQRTLADTPLMRGVMPLTLDGVAKVGMISPQVAVGDLPERLWIKNAGKDPKALDVLPPLTINSRLERKGDVDRFQFPAKPGQRFRIAVQAETLGSQLDGVLRVTDQAGKQLALVDDVDLPPPAPGLPAVKAADPSLDVTVPADANLLIVELRDQRNRGGVNYVYRLLVEPVQADFQIVQPISELNVPRGGSAVLIVPVVRRGYAGPIQLSIPNPPAGLSVQGGRVPANATSGLLTITAAPTGPAEPVLLQVEGKSTPGPGEAEQRHAAVQQLAVSRDANVAASVLRLNQFAVALTGPEPFTVQGPATVEVVKGYSADVVVNLTRGMGQAMLAIEVSGQSAVATPQPGQPPPPGALAFKPAAAAANINNATITITAPTNGPEGGLDIVVQGKAKINNVDKVVVSQALPITILRPFTVELMTPSLTLAPGQMPIIKGKIQRQAVFKEAVTLKLEGLPAGVTLVAPPAPIAAGATDFQIALKVDPKAAIPPTPVSLTLTCATTITGQAYAYPPVTVTVQGEKK